MPAALAEEEEEACVSLQQPQFLTHPSCRSRSSNPLSWGKSFSWREWPGPAPSPSQGCREIPPPADPHPPARVGQHHHLSTSSFPLLCPTCLHMSAASFQERSLPAAALLICLLGKAHLFPSPQGRSRLHAFQQRLRDQKVLLGLIHNGISLMMAPADQPQRARGAAGAVLGPLAPPVQS